MKKNYPIFFISMIFLFLCSSLNVSAALISGLSATVKTTTIASTTISKIATSTVKSGTTTGVSSTNNTAVKPLVNFPIAFANNIGAKLSICNLGKYCSGDMGSTHWMPEATVNVNDQARGLSWSTNDSSVKEGLMQISTKPLGGNWPGDVIYKQDMAVGTFVFDFKILFTSEKPVEPSFAKVKASLKPTITNKRIATINKNKKFDLTKFKSSYAVNFSTVKTQPIYYVRIVPMKDGKLVGAPTNDIKVTVVPPPTNDFKFWTPAKIYTVKIKEFQPLLAPDKGVCAHAMILDTGFTGLLSGQLVKKNAGDRICPSPYKGIGEKPWYEQFWDAMKSGLDWVSDAYNKFKSGIIDGVGLLACGGDSTCKKAISAGLDVGLTVMGIPPTLPNFDQLMNEGFDYLADEVAIGVGCPDIACTILIKNGLKTAINAAKNINPACMDAATAHNMGIEPLCLPSGVKAHWDSAAMYRDAKVVLEVTRNNLNVPNENKNATSSYKVMLASWGYNAAVVGGSITNIEPYNKTLKITKPLDAEIFEYKIIPIPKLEKGQTIDIPVNLVATDYWVPGHKDLMGGWSTVIYNDGWPQYQYNDWYMLYYGAQLTTSASIDGCYFTGSPGCVVSSDTKTLNLPMTLNP